MNKNTPHVVKLSGGRSSGMMLMKLLEEGKLDPSRGDVVVFNNTSAEHSATYEFTRELKHLTERQYNIPFFWIEYQTFEKRSQSGAWSLKPTYRLVNDQPYSEDNPDGYKYKGEVFEEFVSFTGYVPNMLSRTCTISMKIFITNSFLTDWLSGLEGIEQLGHNEDQSYISDDDIVERHRRNGGGVPRDILLNKRKYARDSLFYRKAVKWSDYTSADICYTPTHTESIKKGKTQLYGSLAVDFVSCIGIRADEYRRIVKIRKRIEDAQGVSGKSLFKQPQGEIVLAPLIDNNIVQADVTSFWKDQAFDLNLPYNGIYSNCLYCPLKGKEKLLQIAIDQLDKDPNPNTPESIDWWVNMENKYSRDLKAEGRVIKSTKETNYIGFFGPSKDKVYQGIKIKAAAGEKVDPDMLQLESLFPCNCTD